MEEPNKELGISHREMVWESVRAALFSDAVNQKYISTGFVPKSRRGQPDLLLTEYLQLSNN